MGSKDLKIESNIPGAVRAFEYARNHHYLKLTDRRGNETTLVGRGLIEYSCGDCSFVFWAESNMATHCPVCSSTRITAQWKVPQVALVPDRETLFKLRDDEED